MGEYIKHPEKQLEIKIGVRNRCFLTNREDLIKLKNDGYIGFYNGEYDDTLDHMLNKDNIIYEGYYTAESAQDEAIEFLWNEFEDVTLDDEEQILSDFHIWKAGTDKEDIWHWFDKNHSKHVYYLLYEYEGGY